MRGAALAGGTRAPVLIGVAGDVNSGVASNAERGSDLAVAVACVWSFEMAQPPERLPQ
jgi:hypothetical protein